MNKKLLFLFILPLFSLLTPATAKAQGGVTALMNVVETLQFLKDIKENKGGLEKTVKEIKEKYKESDSTYIVLRDKYNVIKLAGDNILNNLIIDLMDKDKRRLFADRPNLMNESYGESVEIYNNAVDDFKAAYARSKTGDTGIFSFLKKLAGMLIGELITATKKIAIEILVEKLKAPYQMKSWKDI